MPSTEKTDAPDVAEESLANSSAAVMLIKALHKVIDDRALHKGASIAEVISRAEYRGILRAIPACRLDADHQSLRDVLQHAEHVLGHREPSPLFEEALRHIDKEEIRSNQSVPLAVAFAGLHDFSPPKPRLEPDLFDREDRDAMRSSGA